MENHNHKIDPNNFCYVCAQFINQSKRNFTARLREIYWKYFKTSTYDFEKTFTPSFICSSCQRNLHRYSQNNDAKMPFTCPAIWTEYPSHDLGVCYFCSISKPTLKRKAIYFDCDSCKLPRVDLPDLADWTEKQSVNSNPSSVEDDNQTDMEYEIASGTDFKWSLESFNDFCRELNLSKVNSKKCLSMLKRDPDLKEKMKGVTFQAVNKRSEAVLPFFLQNDDFAFCHDIEGLMSYLEITYVSSDWCLFIDSSQSSLKAALMYKNNLLPTLPIAYAFVKEERCSVQKVLELIQYNKHGWLIMCDLKVLNFIMGLKSGYAKYPCFYCMFDSRQSQLDFNPNHIWPVRTHFDKDPLVPIDKIAFPVLHIKLGLFQKFIKALDKGSDCFKMITKHIKKSEAKLVNGVLNGPEIRSLMRLADFQGTMTDCEREAWNNLCDVAKNVLGKNVIQTWPLKVDSLISSLKAMGCKTVSTKMHLLFKHKNKCQPFIGIFSDEHGERLHQDMQVIENRYGPSLNKEMLAECIWNMKRDSKSFSSAKKVF